MRNYQTFVHKDTNLRIACDRFDVVTEEVMKQRGLLEDYILRVPGFATALTPLPLLDGAPEIAVRMSSAAELTGLGPMASVAGTLAQYGAEAALRAGGTDVVIENGGDMYLIADREITVGIYAGKGSPAAGLAFQIHPADTPLAICSSSSKMGHSLSFGNCELATVLATDAALADSAATRTCNEIREADDLEKVLETVGSIPGIRGILAVKGERIGIWGSLPKLVRNQDNETRQKITRDRRSDDPEL